MTQYVQTKIETMEQPLTTWLLLSLVFLLVCAYAYFVNGTITHIVAAKEIQEETTELFSRVGSLENQFLTAKTEINIEYAYSRGLRDDLVLPTYIAKQPAVSLSWNR